MNITMLSNIFGSCTTRNFDFPIGYEYEKSTEYK